MSQIKLSSDEIMGVLIDSYEKKGFSVEGCTLYKASSYSDVIGYIHLRDSIPTTVKTETKSVPNSNTQYGEIKRKNFYIEGLTESYDKAFAKATAWTNSPNIDVLSMTPLNKEDLGYAIREEYLVIYREKI